MPQRKKHSLGFPLEGVTPEHWQTAWDNRGLAYAFLAARGIKGERAEELMADVGWPALIQAAVRFDPAKGMYSTYAHWRLRATWSRYLWRRHKEGFAELDTGVSREPEAAPGEDRFAAEEVEALTGVLRPVSRLMLHQRYGLGMTCQEIGDLHGVTKERVRQRCKELMAVVRRNARHRERATA